MPWSTQVYAVSGDRRIGTKAIVQVISGDRFVRRPVTQHHGCAVRADDVEMVTSADDRRMYPIDALQALPVEDNLAVDCSDGREDVVLPLDQIEYLAVQQRL